MDPNAAKSQTTQPDPAAVAEAQRKSDEAAQRAADEQQSELDAEAAQDGEAGVAEKRSVDDEARDAMQKLHPDLPEYVPDERAMQRYREWTPERLTSMEQRITALENRTP